MKTTVADVQKLSDKKSTLLLNKPGGDEFFLGRQSGNSTTNSTQISSLDRIMCQFNPNSSHILRMTFVTLVSIND